MSLINIIETKQGLAKCMICYHLYAKEEYPGSRVCDKDGWDVYIRLDVLGREHGMTAKKSKREALHRIRFLDTQSSKL